MNIVGTGLYVPGEPVPNAALERVMDTSDSWIVQRTGIRQRHYAANGVGASDLGTKAAERALADAGLTAGDIDYLIFGTMTPDYLFPGSGGLCGAKLGVPGVPALDLRQQCALVPFGLQVADGLVNTGSAETVLFVAGEAHAGFMPWSAWDVVRGSRRTVPQEEYERATRHRGIAVVFGDGAGAMVLRRASQPGRGLLGTRLLTDGRDRDFIQFSAAGFRRLPAVHPAMLARDEHIPTMRGPELFKRAVKELPRVVSDLCRAHGVEIRDIDCVIAHQANERINEAVRQSLGLPPAKMPSNIANYGNTSGATIFILLDELRRDGRIGPGDLLCFVALGAGLHWGASLLRL